MVVKNGHIRIDLEDCINLIRDQRIREFTQHALNKTDKGFWTFPSSQTGLYHPPENNLAPGGIVAHTRKACQTALILIRFYIENGKTQGIDRDEIISAIILHDVTKCGLPGEWGPKTDYFHGSKAAKWIKELYKKLYNEKNLRIDRIAYLIGTHMSVWSKPESEPLKDGDWGQNIVQISDYLAAMRALSFQCNDIQDF